MGAADNIRAGFALGAPLGEGPVSRCWRARHPELGQVVLKELTEPHRLSAAQAAVFRAPGWVLARLGHPHILVCSLYEDGAGQFLAEEELPGGNLRQRVEDASLPVLDALRIARQLALALRAAHASDVFHGNLAPSSVLFDGDERARLGDWSFPLLEQQAREPGRPSEARLCAAPERLQGEPPSVAADVYGLGALLVYMLTRRFPPSADHDDEAFSRFETNLAAMFPSLALVLARMLRPDPNERPTPDALLEACAPYFEEDPGLAVDSAPSLAARTRSLGVSVAPASEQPVEAGRRARERQKFAVQDRLGAGGMGEVWAAVDADLKREVAIKTSLSSNETVQRLFVAEAQITGQLEHPNIVPIHELAEDDDGRPFIVMKKIEGDSLHTILRDLRRGLRPDQLDQFQSAGPGSDPDSRLFESKLQRGPVGPGQLGQVRELTWLLHVFLKICDALAYAHSRGVLHRDLKPANVMVGRFGEVLVLDWGLAAVARPAADGPRRVVTDWSLSGHRAVSDGQLLGTPAYMPPEQARGELSQLDERADVFALGAILYQIITLRMPRSRDSKAAYTEALAGSVLPPSSKSPERWVPDELEAIVLRAMAKERDDRYRDVRALQEEVQAFLDGRTVAAYRYSRLERLLRWGRRNKAAVRLGALATLLVLLGIFGAFQAARAARAAAERDRQARLRVARGALEVRLEGLEQQLAAAAAPGGSAAETALAVFASAHAADIAAIASNDDLAQARPAVAARARSLPARAESLRVAGVLAHARAVRAGLPPPGAADSLSIARAERACADFRRLLTVRGAAADPAPASSRRRLADSLAVAELALWRARVAEARAEPAVQARWVTEAFCAQPRSVAAGRGFLALAEASFAAGAVDRAARQFLLALRTFGERSPPLEAAAWYGLARALAQLPRTAANPLGEPGNNRLLGLRCLLQALDANFRPARGLLEELGQDAQIVELWLEALRRTSLRTARSGILGDLEPGGPYELWAVLRDSGLEVQRFGDARAAGEEALERTLLERIDVAAVLAGAGFSPGRPLRLDWIGGTTPGTLVAILRSADALFVLSLRAEELSVDRYPLQRVAAPRVLDVDGDGLRDLLFYARHKGISEVRIAFGREDGRFAAALDARPRSELPRGVRRHKSLITGADAYDLDGDGDRELVYALAEYEHFAIEVWSVDRERQVRFLGKRLVGKTWLTSLPGEPDRRLLIAPFMPAAFRPFFRRRGVEAPDLRPWLVGLADGRISLTPVSHPFLARGRLQGTRTARALADGDLVVLTDREDRNAWLRSTPDGGFGPTIVLMREAPDQLGPRLARLEGGIYRRADDADLRALAARPPRLDPPRRDRSELATRVRFLYDFGLHAEAARVAREAIDAGVPERDLEAELLRLELRALIADADTASGPLLARLEALTPGGEAAGAVARGIAKLVAAGAPLPRLAAICQVWRDAPGLDPDLRDTFQRAWASWRPLLGAPALDWQGLALRTPAETVAVAPRLVVGDPRLVAWDETLGAFPFVSIRLPEAMRLVGGGSAVTVDSPDALFGIPVRYDGGPLRLVCDVQPRGLHWGSRVDIGLIASDLGTGDRCALGFRITCSGANELNTVSLRGVSDGEALQGKLAIDPAIGRWLRVSVELLPHHGRLRIVVLDRDADVVLGSLSQELPPPPAGSYLLGLGDREEGEPHLAHGVLGRLALWGACEALGPSAGALRALLGQRVDLALKSQAFRNALADRASTVLWQELAQRTLAVATERLGSPSGREADALRRAVLHASLEGWYDGEESFADALSDPAAIGFVLEWALLRLPGARARSRAAGEAIGAIYWGDRDVPARIEALESLRPSAERTLLYATLLPVPLVDAGLVAPERELELVFRCMFVVEGLWEPVLALYFLHLLERYPDVELPPLMSARALQLLQRREEALEAFAEAAQLSERQQAIVEEQQGLAREQAAVLATQRERARAHGVPRPEFPD